MSPVSSPPSLLYRYFFFAWLFRDARQGSDIERWTALRYNRAHSRWLLTYLRRWLVTALLVLGLAVFAEVKLAWPLLAAVFYMSFAIAIMLALSIACCWAFLRFGQRGP